MATNARAGVFDRFEEAIAEASFRAAVTRRRYLCRFEPNNRQWQITETHRRMVK